MLNSYAELGKRITPVILTFNEAPNLRRTLTSLDWAERVVIVDSGSTDETKSIAESFPNVAWKCRAFDTHAQQWDFAIRSSEITSDYVLALDADMSMRRDFLDEAVRHFIADDYAAALVPFRYVLDDVVLRGSLYPAQIRLFRREAVSIEQCGHTQLFLSTGAVYRFKEFLLHDDQKPFERWLGSQLKYAELESARVESCAQLSLKDRLRRSGFMPLIAALTGYVRSGGVFAGKAALRYAQERMLYECIVGIHLVRSASDSSASHV